MITKDLHAVPVAEIKQLPTIPADSDWVLIGHFHFRKSVRIKPKSPSIDSPSFLVYLLPMSVPQFSSHNTNRKRQGISQISQSDSCLRPRQDGSVSGCTTIRPLSRIGRCYGVLALVRTYRPIMRNWQSPRGKPTSGLPIRQESRKNRSAQQYALGDHTSSIPPLSLPKPRRTIIRNLSKTCPVGNDYNALLARDVHTFESLRRHGVVSASVGQDDSRTSGCGSALRGDAGSERRTPTSTSV